MTSPPREATAVRRPPPAARNLVTVFAGLMLGMFLGAVNQTIIAPAMPRIVAELSGMEHYLDPAALERIGMAASAALVLDLTDGAT